jgi:hypothetical protein
LGDGRLVGVEGCVRGGAILFFAKRSQLSAKGGGQLAGGDWQVGVEGCVRGGAILFFAKRSQLTAKGGGQLAGGDWQVGVEGCVRGGAIAFFAKRSQLTAKGGGSPWSGAQKEHRHENSSCAVAARRGSVGSD